MREATGKVVLYKAVDGSIAMDVRLQGETVWLAQKQMSELFVTERSVITKHLRNIFPSKELDEKSVSAKFAHTAEDGTTYLTAFYNLDAIISVGYRVNSKRGTQFRIWATRVLRDHILRGYTVNEGRLKELNQAIRLIADVAERRVLSGEEASAFLRVAADYSFALRESCDMAKHKPLVSQHLENISRKALGNHETRLNINLLYGPQFCCGKQTLRHAKVFALRGKYGHVPAASSLLTTARTSCTIVL